MATASQKSDHVSKVRQAATDLLNASEKLAALQNDWNWLDMGNQLTDDDCQGLTVAQIAAVYTTLAAVETLLAAGHGTNLATVRVG